MSKDARAIVETVECRNKGTCRRKCPTTPCNRIASSACLVPAIVEGGPLGVRG